MDALIVVAHPDDEVIWSGGLILRYSHWNWRVLSLCRADDADRAPRFFKAAEALGAVPAISDLEDGSPTLGPLSADLQEIKERIRRTVPSTYEVILTHGPRGEYTRHLRHEQVHSAVRDMVESKELTGSLYSFAYQDCCGSCVPHPAPTADVLFHLTPDEFRLKRHILTELYGFSEDGFEYAAAGSVEALARVRGSAHIFSIDNTKAHVQLGG